MTAKKAKQVKKTTSKTQKKKERNSKIFVWLLYGLFISLVVGSACIDLMYVQQANEQIAQTQKKNGELKLALQICQNKDSAELAECNVAIEQCFSVLQRASATISECKRYLVWYHDCCRSGSTYRAPGQIGG